MMPLFGLLSPSGARSRLSVLIFHRVPRSVDALFPDEVDAPRFDRLCGWLRRWFHVLPLDQAVKLLAQGRLPARALAITFDDGYADNHDVALPILQKHGLPATFFIATGFLDGGEMWNDSLIEAVRGTALRQIALPPWLPQPTACASVAEKRQLIHTLLPKLKYLPMQERLESVRQIARTLAAPAHAPLMMNSWQVVALRDAGMQIGAHTVNHPILARLSADEARAEMAASRDQLQGLLGEPVELFAYPNGRPDEDYSATTVRLARELGFSAAVTTAWGAARPGSDLFQLPRFTPWDRGRWAFAARMARNFSQPVTLATDAGPA